MVSERCGDKTTYWDRERRTCVPCGRKPGFEVTPNCGRDDDGGIHFDYFTRCKPNTFNNGTFDICQRCSPCPTGLKTLKPCNSTSDTICQEKGQSTAATFTNPTTTHATPSFRTSAVTQNYAQSISPEEGSLQNTSLWAVPITIIAFAMLTAAVCALKMKKKRGLCKTVFYHRRTSYKNEGFSPISSSTTSSEVLEDILNAQILSAPLHAVLDDLDVLEELVILLDPDTQGIKSTKHLASHCSFPSTWITYTYSMKDSKSPLKAVLEAVTSKQPDWTVGHLAKLLRQMGRNDAIAVLAKLRPDSNMGYV